jgi:predicted transcriptional regulator
MGKQGRKVRDTFSIVSDLLLACELRNLTDIAEVSGVNHVVAKKMLPGFVKRGWVSKERRGGIDIYQLTTLGKVTLTQLEQLASGLPGH